MGCRHCVSTSRNTRHAGLIHRCGKRRRGLRCKWIFGFDAVGPPPWAELQWVTLRNVIELAEDSYCPTWSTFNFRRGGLEESSTQILQFFK